MKDKIVWGGIYIKVIRERNEQNYNIYVPLYDGENYYMIDTYHLDSSLFINEKVFNGLDRFLNILKNTHNEEIGKRLKNRVYNFYHKNMFVIIDENSLKDSFELVCDLNEYEIIKRNEISKYYKEDLVLDIPLYQEHNYSWDYGKTLGISLVRKGSKRNYKREINNKISELHMKKPETAYHFQIKELKRLARESSGDFNNKAYRDALAKNNFLEKQEKEYILFCRKLRFKK